MPAEEDGDLMLCREHGLAYQKDRAHRVEYGEAYFDKCAGYEGEEIARKINAGRFALVARHIVQAPVCDVGIGSGEFLKLRPNTWGCDVNPVAIEWLKRHELWAPTVDRFAGVTMWDVIEHLPEPEAYLRQIKLHAWLFVSLPVFYGLGAIRESKHYRPGEHLQYFTEDGFVAWAELHGFRVRERADFETEAGRESILSFALQRYRWPR
jgi:hypothetical protein